MQEKLGMFMDLDDLKELNRAGSTVRSVSARGVASSLIRLISFLLCIATMGRVVL